MWSIIGVDCATQPANVGLALAHIDKGELFVDEVARGLKHREPVAIIYEWIKKSEKVLLALDAPLGWPDSLGSSLVNHKAGQVISTTANKLFRRYTDDEICRRFDKRPLEVGANLIARTAEAALRLLGELRDITGNAIPLAWEPHEKNGVWSIEVYPAATLLALGVSNSSEFVESPPEDIHLPDSLLLKTSHHVRDAVICAFSGGDFLNGKCLSPTQEQRNSAIKEGWIWTRA